MKQASNQVGAPRVIKIVLIGTLGVTAALTCLLIASLFIYHNGYVAWRILVGLGILAYLAIAILLYQGTHYKSTSWMLIALYAAVATSILATWSINAPIGVLMLGFVIFLSGVMLGARYIIPVTIGTVVLLFCLQALDHFNLIDPDRSLLSVESTFGDVASYATIFAVFALIAWLAGRQTEASLNRALLAERALKKEKARLASRLEKRTRMLREAQLEEMRQLYDFAELGQLTTVILHDLANQLSVLTLDIDDLRQSNIHTSAVLRAKESIRGIDEMVRIVRKKINYGTKPEKVNVGKVLQEVTNLLKPLATRKHIKLTSASNKQAAYARGDPIRLSQVFTILLNNALGAKGVKNISIMTTVTRSIIKISITDDGLGVAPHIRKKLFEPIRSSKANGLGIGLYIARQIIVTHFKGKIYLDSELGSTSFVIELPSSTIAPTPPTSSVKA
jgi:signal transduction histidine kinase